MIQTPSGRLTEDLTLLTAVQSCLSASASLFPTHSEWHWPSLVFSSWLITTSSLKTECILPRGPLDPCLYSMIPAPGWESCSQVVCFKEALSALLCPGLSTQVDSKVRSPTDPVPKGLSILRELGTVALSSCPERWRTWAFRCQPKLDTPLIKPHEKENTTATICSRGSIEYECDWSPGHRQLSPLQVNRSLEEKECFVFGHWTSNLQSRDLNFQIMFFLYFSHHAQQIKKGQKEGTVGELKTDPSTESFICGCDAMGLGFN